MMNIRLLVVVSFLLANIMKSHGETCPQEIHQKLDLILQLLENQLEETGHCKEVVNANEEKEEKEKDLVCFTNENLEKIVAKTKLTQENYLTAADNGLDRRTPLGQQFKDFLHMYPNGKMTWKDFEYGWTPKIGNETVEKLGEHLLRIYDSDRDCSSDFMEYTLTDHIFNYGSAEELFARIFRAFDMDADGFVGYQEMDRIVKAMSIPIYDWIKDTVDDEYVKQALIQMDKNYDGVVSQIEFVKPITKKDYFQSFFIDIIFKMLVSGPNSGPRGSQLGLLTIGNGIGK